MNKELQELLERVKAKGSMTEKQREIILRKAEALGEDMDEVEFLLEGIPHNLSIDIDTVMATDNGKGNPVALSGRVKKESVSKCPHCGAPITDTMLTCPECGYALQYENAASIEARAAIEQLRDRLIEVEKEGGLFRSLRKKGLLIQTFTMPSTKEGLIQFLEFAYSNYISDSVDYRDDWYAKVVQASNMLARLGSDNPEVQEIIERYARLIENFKIAQKKQKKEEKDGEKSVIKNMIWFILGVVLFCLCMQKCDDKSDDDVIQRVQTCIQNHDYQSAKVFALKLNNQTDRKKLIDEISLQEIAFVLSQGEIEQAKIVAALITDENKREAVMHSISEAEKNERRDDVPEKKEIVENAEMQNTNAVTVFKEIMEYIRNEDFQGARAKAGNNQELLDEIAANEVNWYIIQGALGNAKKAAATVHDERKKEELLKEIWEHEFNQ